MQGTTMRAEHALARWPDLLLAYGHPDEWPMVPFRRRGCSHPLNWLKTREPEEEDPWDWSIDSIEEGAVAALPLVRLAERHGLQEVGWTISLDAAEAVLEAATWREEYGDEVEMIALMECGFS